MPDRREQMVPQHDTTDFSTPKDIQSNKNDSISMKSAYALGISMVCICGSSESVLFVKISFVP